MGNNLAPTLAIIYMNELHEQIIQKSGGAVSLKRFIDDIFAVLTSDKINDEKLLEISNSLSDAIKFTIELPKVNKLPFLDTLVSFDYSNNKFSTELYVKPIHSQSITPWDSHGSVSSKRGIVIGEIKRAMACSTDKKTERRSIDKVIKMFRSNGYPKRFLKSVVRRTTKTKCSHDVNNSNTIYLKLPFVNEQLKRRALTVLRNVGIKNIKISFINGLSLARVFAPRKESLDCKPNCETCSMALKSNKCFKKNVVYQISCCYCDLKYIGETGRTIGSRIKEHLKMSKQTVYVHLKSHGLNPQEGTHITWEIVHSNLKYYNERKTIEAIEIQKCSQHLMNGCVGRIISI